MPGYLAIMLRNLRVWRSHFLASLVGNLGQPFLFLLAMGYGLGREIPPMDGLTYLQFIAPGLAASAVMYSAAFETTYGSYTRLSLQRTFEAILCTPLMVRDIALGEIGWGAAKGMFAGLIMIACLPLFGVWPSGWIVILIPVLFVCGLFFAALGLIMTALADNYEFFNYFISLVITPLFLFSGIFFPLDGLAPTARTVFSILPLTPVVSLSRMFCYGRFEEPVAFKLAGIIIATLAATFLAEKLLSRRLIR